MLMFFKIYLIAIFIGGALITIFLYIYEDFIYGLKNFSSKDNSLFTNAYNKFSRVFEKGDETTIKSLLIQTLNLETNNKTYNNTLLGYRIQGHKRKLMAIMEFHEENPSFKQDPYKVGPHYNTWRTIKYTLEDILCDFKRIRLTSLKSTDWEVHKLSNSSLYPERDIFEDKHFNTCALVSSSGSMLRSNLGKEIDSHDFVVRLNNAPTKGYERDVGNKTNLRIVNSYLVSVLLGPKINNQDLYNMVDYLLFFDVPNYMQSLHEWFKSPVFKNFIDIYLQRQRKKLNSKSYVLYPDLVWEQYRVMMKYTDHKLPYKPPSSGFMTFLILLSVCDSVDLYEFVPSLRMTDRCYYWKGQTIKNCSFKSEHPLATEKKLYFLFNQFDDVTTFEKGVVRVAGFNQLQCPNET